MRVAIWTEKAWALGRIHEEIVRCIPEHEFTFFDWRVMEENDSFISTYRDYDVILGNTAILFLPKSLQNLDYIYRCLCISHCPVLDHVFYTEKVPYTRGPTYMGVSPECCNAVMSVLNEPVKVCPFGINATHFPKGPCPRTFAIAGVTGLNDHKNTQLLARACARLGLQLLPCTPKDFTAHKELYSSFDVFLCASAMDAGPLGNFEAAALGIPVLSTRVGNWKYVKSAKFFETEDQAVDILARWHSCPEERIRYAETVRDEIHSLWTNDLLIRTHLLPVLESFGYCADILDIGASLPGTLRSIHVDPLASTNHAGRVERAAIVETPLDPVIFTSTESHPDWIQGCARIGHPHPSCKTAKPGIVRIMTLAELVRKYNLRYVDEVVLVVEGYEVYIVQALLRCMRNGLVVRTLRLLWNELTSEHEKAFCKYLLRDYAFAAEPSMLVYTLHKSLA